VLSHLVIFSAGWLMCENISISLQGGKNGISERYDSVGYRDM